MRSNNSKEQGNVFILKIYKNNYVIYMCFVIKLLYNVHKYIDASNNLTKYLKVV